MESPSSRSHILDVAGSRVRASYYEGTGVHPSGDVAHKVRRISRPGLRAGLEVQSKFSSGGCESMSRSAAVAHSGIDVLQILQGLYELLELLKGFPSNQGS